jgi:DNA-binding CsgD family transcriptional regulator
MKFKPNIAFDKILGKEHVSAMEFDKNNTIYYIQNKELGVLKEKNFGEFTKETGIFKHINKLINDDLPKITTIDEENIIIGAKEGFIHFNPSKLHKRNNNFSTLIREIEIFEKNDTVKKINPNYSKDIKLNSEEIIKINYSSPYFDGFEDLKYSYRLLPLDKSWSQWSSNNSKGYDHLPYGNYKFEVKARNIYGEESVSSRLDFTFKAPWYASKSAKIGYFSIGVLLFILVPVIQSKRYNSVAEEIGKELKIKEEEIDKLNSEKLKSELKLKNEQLTSITMQLLKNKEFILNIQDKIESTLKEGNSKIQLQRLLKTIDSEVTKNDNWDEFAYHFDQVHGNYLQKLYLLNIRLSPREIKLAALLRMNMSSKEISQLLNIETRSVELARYRLRKKLGLERKQSLVEFLISLDKS